MGSNNGFFLSDSDITEMKHYDYIKKWVFIDIAVAYLVGLSLFICAGFFIWYIIYEFYI
jgi:hypothetical protein